MCSNPYASPSSETLRNCPQLLRHERSELISVVNRYLNEEITAFEFDDELQRFYNSSDPAVRFVALDLWFHYDDCDDHLACLTRAEWGYFQRLLLLLESDATIEETRSRRWDWTQVVALLTLLGFCALANKVGWGQQLLVFAMLFGVVSITLSRWRLRADRAIPYGPALYPFTSFATLREVYERVGFCKPRYPGRLANRKIRSPAMTLFWNFHHKLMWLMFAPVALVFQTLPECKVESKVVV